MTKPSIHPTADVQSDKLGDGTRVWQYVVILADAVIGSDSNICSHCFIENDVIIGHRVTVKCGVQLWDGIRVEDDVFIGPNVTFTNDPFPRSRQPPNEFTRTVIKQGASIGANATLLPGITIGTRAMIGAGSVVTRDVPPGAVVVGNPAKVVRYADTVHPATEGSRRTRDDVTTPIVDGVRWLDMTVASDVRGQLTVTQWDQHLPFLPERAFFVHHVPSAKVRGEHAHKVCEQVLIALGGSVKVVVDDGHVRQQFSVADGSRGLYIPAGIWATQYDYSPDCVLAVFASHKYDESDYLRDYDQYLAYRKQ